MISTPQPGGQGVTPSARHERNIVFEFGIGEMDRPAKLRGAIESHKHFHDADPVIEGFCRNSCLA